MIVTVSPNPALDVSTAVDRVVPDRKLRCDEPRREPGGGGVNVARAARRLGGEAMVVWTKGGATGSLMHELLDAEGVPHRPIAIPGAVRESFAVFDRSSKRQYRFSMPGPTLPADALQPLITEVSRVEAPRLVVGSGSVPAGSDDRFYARLAVAMSDRGCKVVIDTSGAPLRRALESRRVYLIKPNIRELADLVGHPLQDDDAIAAAAGAIVARGEAEVVVASLEARGMLAVTKDQRYRITPPPVQANSTVGAGDSSVAGITLALSRGEPLDRALRFGVAAGTAAVITPGSELCRRADVERLFAEMT